MARPTGEASEYDIRPDVLRKHILADDKRKEMLIDACLKPMCPECNSGRFEYYEDERRSICLDCAYEEYYG